ncbi:MAG TPA: hypothetical protein VNH64_12905, partial [Parvularculaceae bacterium]|nr:hypothetical protein [Parvularculaceae bacterium]
SDLESKALRDKDNTVIPRVAEQFGACRDAIAANRPLPLLPTRPGRPQRTCAQSFFRGLPEVAWSDELNDKLMEIARTKPEMYDADISEMAETPFDQRYLQHHRFSLGARPVRILTSGNHAIGSIDPPRATSLENLKYQYDVALAQSGWLKLSSNAKQIFARRSSEYIQFDEPDTVVDAVREVYDQSK